MGVVEELPLEVREVHVIKVHDAQGADAGSSQVQGRR
jgi:hypothetical protein